MVYILHLSSEHRLIVIIKMFGEFLESEADCHINLLLLPFRRIQDVHHISLLKIFTGCIFLCFTK